MTLANLVPQQALCFFTKQSASSISSLLNSVSQAPAGHQHPAAQFELGCICTLKVKSRRGPDTDLEFFNTLIRQTRLHAGF